MTDLLHRLKSTLALTSEAARNHRDAKYLQMTDPDRHWGRKPEDAVSFAKYAFANTIYTPFRWLLGPVAEEERRRVLAWSELHLLEAARERFE